MNIPATIKPETPTRLPGLDGLRAIAALTIAVHHAEQVKFLNGLPNIWENIVIQYVGTAGVSFFFVLSGFLITYLLLNEIRQFDRIDFRAFYIRRALRILPLYYFIVVLGFFVLAFLPAYDVPTTSNIRDSSLYFPNLIAYCILCPQVAAAYISIFSYAGPMWSVGTEEWFYAGWPWLVDRFRHRLPYLCILLIMALPNLRYYSFFYYPQLAPLLFVSRFDCMAVGALAAYIGVFEQRYSLCSLILRFVFRTDVQVLTYLTLEYALLSGDHFGVYEHPVFAAIYAIIIMNVALNYNVSLIKTENAVLRYLGKISYGIYAYNWVALVTMVIVTKHALWFASQHAKANVIEYGGIGLTIAFSAVSYRFLEEPFLRLKKRFEKTPEMTAQA